MKENTCSGIVHDYGVNSSVLLIANPDNESGPSGHITKQSSAEKSKKKKNMVSVYDEDTANVSDNSDIDEVYCNCGSTTGYHLKQCLSKDKRTLALFKSSVKCSTTKFNALELNGLVEICSSINPIIPHGLPPDQSWMDKFCAYISKLLQNSKTKSPICIAMHLKEHNCGTELLKPHTIIRVHADGLCLYRAIARLATGNENCHSSIREAIVQFVQLKENLHLFDDKSCTSRYRWSPI